MIAFKIALDKPKRKVYCLDGDGALLMHMGAMALIGSRKPKNLIFKAQHWLWVMIRQLK